MQTTPLTTFIQNYRWTVLAGEAAGLSDGRLLESFITCNDDAAFGALVKRHGRMVLGVCRRVLRNSHDAEDAFQATFCVLFCKAASVNPRERVGSWLHGVAYLTALKAKALVAKLHARERQMIDVPDPKRSRKLSATTSNPFSTKSLPVFLRNIGYRSCFATWRASQLKPPLSSWLGLKEHWLEGWHVPEQCWRNGLPSTV